MNTLRLVGCVLLLTIILSLSSVAAFAQAATFTATPSPVPPGQTVTFTGNPVIPVTVSNVKVTLWFYNSAGGYVGSASETGLNFTANQPTPVTITYSTSSSLAVGTYTYNLSYYNSDGSHVSGAPGQTNDGSFVVGTSSGASYTITPSPNPVTPGQTVTFYASLNPNVTYSGAKVTLWFYNSSGGYIGSASKTGVNFTAGQSTSVIITYATSSSLAVGTYTYNLSYYNSSGTALAGATGQVDAGSFTVAAAGMISPVCASAVVVGLKWSAVSGAATYNISRNGSNIVTGTALLTYTDQGVAASTAYTYVLSALNSSGSTVSTQTLHLTTPAATPTGDAAYCPSSVIAGMTWNWSTGFNQQNGSDLWPNTWGADGNIYLFFGDGGGFFGSNNIGRASFGIGELTGSIPAAGTTPQITTVNAINVYGGFNGTHSSTINGKTNSIMAIGSNFYALGGIYQSGEGGPSGGPNHYEMIHSTGNAYSWVSNYSSWIFCSDQTSPTGLCPTSFVNFGAGNAGAIDNYVYLLGATEDNFIGDGTLGLCSCTYLARVLNDNTSLLTKASYQVYTGVNAAGVAQWSNTWSNMQPIFVDHGPRPMHLGKMVYNSALQRFISAAQGGSVNQAAFFDSPNPWGPFTTIAYYNSNLDKTGGWGNLGDGTFAGGHGDSMGINFMNKWTSSNGLTMWATFSSNGTASSNASLTALQGQDMDSFSVVSVTLTLH